MKLISLISLIIGIIALCLIYIGQTQLSRVQQIQNDIQQDIVNLKQEIVKLKPTKQTQSEETEFPRYHNATGVLKLIRGDRIIVDEDEIPGFMRAMIMSYKVENPEKLKDLKEGDKVKLKLKETETTLTVIDIEKAE